MTVLDGDPQIRPGLRAGVVQAAAARAHESALRPPLFTDPYAQTLLDAAGPAAPPDLPDVTNHVAARTKWFDEFFLTASSAGVSQVVILGAGLDTRAWRLPWLNDTVIFEVDKPHILEYKSRVLAESGAAPSTRYVPVTYEMGDDWPKALTAAGFVYTEPTAWAAEGFFPALTGKAQEHLLDRIELYSARGSRLAVQAGAESPTDVACWLCARHWEVTSTTAVGLMHRYRRAAATGDDGTVFVEGRKL